MSINKAPLELNDGFKYALDVLEKTNQSLFLTGRAGTGKSTLLQLFRSTTRKKMVVLAPTGIAALNVQGQTIHSFFGFPPRFIQAKDIVKHFNKKWFQKIDVLVIDEISMVRADLLDAIDRSLRLNRENPMPFGGVQMVFVGDLFQLPPVIASAEEKRVFEMAYQSPYFFSANVLREFDFEKMELRKVYRQEQRHFLRLLDSVRLNQVDYEDLDDLNQRYEPQFEAERSFITLSPRNAKVDRINLRELANLDTLEQSFTAKVQGEFDPKQYPTDMELRLKEGAQVMFIKNDPDGNFVNGTIGKITAFDNEGIKVFTDEQGSPKVINVVPVKWEIIRYRPSKENPDEIEAEVIGTFEQYPLRLAWAVTIHKSQGKTFDKVIIDMDTGAFEFGQTYVALSRCRTLEGIVLRQLLKHSDILTDERVVDYYEQNF
ncbi:MAG: AAA family ATPase [Saprospiraceae bacterium]|nr:AAA family ATPase [Saprospiraceae bacterium]